jgi:hypothetical protein
MAQQRRRIVDSREKREDPRRPPMDVARLGDHAHCRDLRSLVRSRREEVDRDPSGIRRLDGHRRHLLAVAHADGDASGARVASGLGAEWRDRAHNRDREDCVLHVRWTIGARRSCAPALSQMKQLLMEVRRRQPRPDEVLPQTFPEFHRPAKPDVRLLPLRHAVADMLGAHAPSLRAHPDM